MRVGWQREFYFSLTKYNERTQFVEEMFFTKILRQVNFSIFIVLQTVVYIAERSVIQWNFSDLKNPRFIVESGFKSRAGYNGTRTVYENFKHLKMTIWTLLFWKILFLSKIATIRI